MRNCHCNQPPKSRKTMKKLSPAPQPDIRTRWNGSYDFQTSNLAYVEGTLPPGVFPGVTVGTITIDPVAGAPNMDYLVNVMSIDGRSFNMIAKAYVDEGGCTRLLKGITTSQLAGAGTFTFDATQLNCEGGVACFSIDGSVARHNKMLYNVDDALYSGTATRK